jgi:8-oxo-dGTP pyrophosphatase MutT (NUDIX family)
VTAGPPSDDSVVDVPERWPVTASDVVFDSTRVVSVRRDTVAPPSGGEPFIRDVVAHPGAVGVIALDEQMRVLVVHQYRHPVGHRLVEAPAGLLDHPGEAYHDAVARELYEEGHVAASDWRVLVDYFTSPGMTNETLRVYVARGISAVPEHERHSGDDEEADMPTAWVPLDELVRRVLAGELHNPTLCVGVLATWVAVHGNGIDALRPAEAPWPAREAVPR